MLHTWIQTRFILVLIVITLSSSVQCFASPVDLISQADAIVIASVTDRVESNSNVYFDLDVDRVIKGGQNGSVIHVSHDWQRAGISLDVGPRALTAHYYGIWFLIRKTSSDWDVLPVTQDGHMFSLFAPASKNVSVAYAYQAGTPVSDALVYELGAAFEAEPRSANEMLLPAVVVGSAADKVLTRFSTSSDIKLQAAGVAGMLARSQPRSLEALHRSWPALKESANKDIVLSELRNSFRSSDLEAIAQLINLASDVQSGAELRTAATRAITAVHTKESLPFLGTLLDSADPEEQLRGIIGISSFANGCPPQTPANVASMEYLRFVYPTPFRTEATMAHFAFGPVSEDRRTELLAFWRDWWTSNRSTLFGN